MHCTTVLAFSSAAGFKYITEPDSPPSGLIRLWKVFYDDAVQRRIVTKAVAHHWEKKELTVERRTKEAVDAIQFFMPTFKNSDFKEEKELRLIFTPYPQCSTRPQFRVSRGMLVPYYSLRELSGGTTTPRPLPISQIRVGPSINKVLNTASTRMLMASAGYGDDFPVISSDTPYRG